jgi:hypothetical protein
MTSPARVVETDPITSVWITITLGTIPRDQLDQKLQDNNTKISDQAAEMMQQDAFTVAQREERINLVSVSVAELGFDEATCYKVICQRAKEHDLEPCPAEVGPQLRLQYKDQPIYEWILVAMKALQGCDGSLRIFDVGRTGDGKLWLKSYSGDPDYHWAPGCRFLFWRRKPVCPADRQPSDF